MTQWLLEVNGSFETGLYDVTAVDTANPFGNYAVAKIDDQTGDKFDTYTRGTRVRLSAYTDTQPSVLTINTGEIETVNNATQTHRKIRNDGTLQVGPTGIQQVGTDAPDREFVGYVVESRELDQQGADALEVEIYSFDQFLRQNTVTNDQSGNTISEALEDIITTDTPVTWNASNVTVESDIELSRSYRGETVENAIRDFQQKSSNEAFGVENDIEFFYRPRESSSAPRDIDNTQWLDYDIPEKGKETINEVTVFYADGDKSVTVDDGADKLELQDNLGTDRPVGFSEEVSRPDITDIDDARDVGEAILQDRKTTLTGTVTTFGLLGASPGDVLNIEIIPRGIDGNFQIAEIEYRWGRDKTILTIVEKTGDQDEYLVRLSDSVKRVETRNANRDGTSNRITDSNVGVVLPITGDVDGTSFDNAKVTNLLRNKLRDGWGDGSTVDITEIAVGNDDTPPSRSQTSLGNELERVSVSESFPDSQSVLYEGAFTETDISEVGLFNSTGDMVARATVSGSFSGSPSVDFRIDVENDTSFTLGVVTTTGQTAVRDILADNSPNTPTDYAYGSDGTDPTISDTSLGNQQIELALDNLLVQNADTESEWNEITTADSSSPVHVTSGGELTNYQSGFFREGENADRFQDGFDPGSTDTEISNDDYLDLSRGPDSGTPSGVADFGEWDFTLDYDIPKSDIEFHIRQGGTGNSGTSGGIPKFRWELDHANGNTYLLDFNDILGPTQSDNFTWDQLPFYQGSPPDTLPSTFPAGDYTLRIVLTDSDGGQDVYYIWIDAIAVVDAKYSYTFDETTGSNDELDGPEQYPDVETSTFTEVNTRRELDSATATQTWDDTSNSQFIELSNDGGNTFIRTNNSQTASASFGSPSTTLQTRVGISRYTSDGTTSPATGDTSQAIDVHNLSANISAITPVDIGVADIRAIVQPGDLVGTTLREGGEFDTNDNLLTRVTFAEFTVQSGERIISSERFRFANP